LPPLDHEKFLRRSFEVARGARGSGNHPFGTILVDAAGAVLLEVETGFMPDRAMTGHAERLGDGREERFLGWLT
jgi:tRNA(Arg) A34 adenosine deaminase TadA